MKQKKAVSYYKCSPKRVAVSRTEAVDNDLKKKRIIIDNHQIGLRVMISRAVGIDDPKRYPYVISRHYNVVHWVRPGEELRTRMTEGVAPLWNHESIFLLDSLDPCMFLNVEVQRFNSMDIDPGTSIGRVVVGRARIPLPAEFNRDTRGAFPLVRTEGKDHRLEGRILFAMRLEKIRIGSPCLYQEEDVGV